MTYTKPLKPCGTRAAYTRHRYHDDDTCFKCGWRKPKTPDRILDLMETEDRWMPIDVLIALMVDRFPTLKEDTIYRATWRLVVKGRLRTQVDPDDERGQRLLFRLEE